MNFADARLIKYNNMFHVFFNRNFDQSFFLNFDSFNLLNYLCQFTLKSRFF